MSLDTKCKIVEIASKLFARFGFHKTSMDEIAKISRKAKGSLYYHFASKEDLFKEVVVQEIETMKASLLLIVNDKSLSPVEKLRNYLNQRMEILASAQNYHETLKADLFEQFDFLNKVRHDLDNWEKLQLKTIFDEGRQATIFTAELNEEVAIDMFVLILRMLEVPFFTQNKFEQYHPHFNDLLNILIKGLKP